MFIKSALRMVSAGLLGLSFQAGAIPVQDISNLDSITFWERTGGTSPVANTFSIFGSELTTRLADPLATNNYDIQGVAGKEFYDVFFSNADGSFNLDGEYLTIEGVFSEPLPAGGGLNLAEISLNFSGGAVEYGNFIASYVALGDNALPGTIGYAIDGDLQTHTTMGNTSGQNDRLRLTLGFLSSSGPVQPVPAPTLLVLLSTGLLLTVVSTRGRKKQ